MSQNLQEGERKTAECPSYYSQPWKTLPDCLDIFIYFIFCVLGEQQQSLYTKATGKLSTPTMHFKNNTWELGVGHSAYLTSIQSSFIEFLAYTLHWTKY